MKLPGGIYTDGKRMPTLVRETTETRVQVPGGRGRGAHRMVTKTSNQVVIEDHYPVVAEPGGEYVDHITPVDGSGKGLATGLITVAKEREGITRVLGMDGCAVNTGKNTGAIRLFELEMGPVQHVICGLHLNELLFWHILSETDGVTKGPEKLSGPVGSTLHLAIWEEPVVCYRPLAGKVVELPPAVVADLSRDQNLGYRYCIAVQTGHMPDDLVGQTIGPMVTSRWNTTATRVLCKYTRTRKPSKKLIRLTQATLNLYYPGWFKFKCRPHIQDGATNYFHLVELTRDMDPEDRRIGQKVLQDNAHWPHSDT
jgi:hypothetical protein